MNKLLMVVATMAALLAPSTASAHAHLKRSSPSGGTRLLAPPQLIQLWFSEQPELSATYASLADSSGRAFVLSPVEREPSGAMGVRFHVLGALKPGRYTLTWRTAAADGHPSSGKFGFVVLNAPPGTSEPAAAAAGLQSDSGGDAVVRSRQPSSPGSENLSSGPDEDAASSIANSLARAVLFIGLLALIGAVTFKLLVLRAARAVPRGLTEVMSQRAAAIGLASVLLLIVGGLLRLYLEHQMMAAMPDMPDMHGMGVRAMIMHTDWGFAYLMQILAAIASLVGFALALRRRSGGWVIAAIAALILAVTPALSGHAAASPRFKTLMIIADSLHVLGGSTWLGSLLCVMAVGIPVARGLEATERWKSISDLVNAFSPIALASAGLVVISGVFASWIHLERVSALWQTTYGKTLLVKLFLVAITLAIGAYNLRKVQPLLSTPVGTDRLRRSATVELAAGFLILLVTGLLTGISP